MFTSYAQIQPRHVIKSVERLTEANNVQTAKELLRYLPSWNVECTIELYTTLLHSFVRVPFTVQDLLEFHKHVISSVKPDLFYYTKLADIFIQSGEFKEIEKLQKEMTEQGIEPDTIFFNILIDGYTTHNNISEGIEILKYLIKNQKCDQLSFTSLLAHSLMNRNFDLVQELTNLMSFTNITPTIDFFKRIHVFAKGDVQKVRLLFQEMKKLSIQPDTFLYNSLLECYVKQRKNISLGRSVVEEMISNGVEPNLSTYNILLNGYSFEGDKEGFLRTSLEMDENHISPDIRTINSKMNLFLTRKEYQVAIKIFYNEIENNFLPDQYSYIYLFNALGNVEDLNKIQSEMRELRLQSSSLLNTRVFTSYLTALARCNAWNEVELEIDWMINSDDCKPNLHTFTSVLDICRLRGKWDIFDKFVKLHDKVLGSHVVSVTYNNLTQRRQSMLFKLRFGNKI